MDLKLLAGLGFIGAGMVIVAISQFVTIGSVLKFPLVGPWAFLVITNMHLHGIFGNYSLQGS